MLCVSVGRHTQCSTQLSLSNGCSKTNDVSDNVLKKYQLTFHSDTQTEQHKAGGYDDYLHD